MDAGLCMCGCGQRTPLSTKTRTARGDVKGQPVRFVNGHNRRGKRNRPIYDGPIYRVDPATGCHVWLRGTNDDGYGQLTIDGQLWRAHLLVWWCEHGPPPPGTLVDHRCRHRACINIEHMRLATVAQNAQNRSSKRLRGASLDLKSGRWRAFAQVANEPHYLGFFDTEAEAGEVAAAWRALNMPFSQEFHDRVMAGG